MIAVPRIIRWLPAAILAGIALLGAFPPALELRIVADGPLVALYAEGETAPLITTQIEHDEAGAIELGRAAPQSSPLVFPGQRIEALLRPKGAEAIDLIERGDCFRAPSASTCRIPGEWKNYELTLKCTSCVSFSVTGRRSANGGYFTFRGRPWAHRDSVLIWSADGKKKQTLGARRRLTFSFGKSLRLVAAELTPHIAIALLLYLLALGAVDAARSPRWGRLLAAIPAAHRDRLAAFGVALASRWNRIAPKILPWRWDRVVLLLAVSTAFGMLAGITYFLYENVPHVPDSIVYWNQARMFASGLLTLPELPISEHFEGTHHYFRFKDGKGFGIYPFGWPLAFALWHLLGVPWLAPASIGAATVALLWIVTRNHATVGAAILTVTLALTSPWFQMSASNFMAHNFAALLSLCCFLALLRWERTGSHWSAVACGAALGLLLNVRPLNAAALAVVLGAFILLRLVRERRWQWSVASMAATVIVFVGLFYAWNAVRTGSPWRDPYGRVNPLRVLFTMDGKNAALCLSIWWETLGFFRHVALSLPHWLVLVPASLALLMKPDAFERRAFAFCAAVPVAYFLVPWSAPMHGPRFWYEALPFFVILSAVGLIKLYRAMGESARAGLFVALLFLPLGLWSQWHWWGDKKLDPAAAHLVFTPKRIHQLRNYNSTNTRLYDRIRALPEPSIVFITKVTHWASYGVVTLLNSPDLVSGHVIVARDLGPQKNQRLIQAYPLRKVYVADYFAATLEPYYPGPLLPSRVPAKVGR